MSKTIHKSKKNHSKQTHKKDSASSDDRECRKESFLSVSSIIIVVISIFTSKLYPKTLLHKKVDLPVDEVQNFHKERRRCKRYLAQSSIPNAGLGVFTTENIPEQTLIDIPGDVVIHLTDINPYTAQSLKMLLYDYAWDSQDFEGMYEGKMVYSIVPGIGMLANGHQTLFNTDQALSPSIDHAGVTRMNSPMAGSFSHYHNYSFITTADILPGGEILMNYGEEWFKEREKVNRIDTLDTTNQTDFYRSIDWLMDNGICLDYLEVRASTREMAGRGAFATEDIKAGSVVAPVPVLPIEKNALTFYRYKDKNDGTDQLEIQEMQQLLLNYCYGHRHSSILLFPYGYMVNFINHDSTSPNVELRWSRSSQPEKSVSDLMSMDRSGLMLESIALRDIKQDEEVFFDYGSEWEYLYQKYVLEWEPEMNMKDYVYAHELDLSEEIVRTAQEQLHKPYHSSIFTSCYYKYSKAIGSNRSNHIWRKYEEIFHSENLRPCTILDRVLKNHTSEAVYTVAIRNRFGLTEKEIIPQGQKHIVTNVPRYAIRFSHKIYTSDQHISGFRSHIFLRDGIFPSIWMDLK